MDLPVKRHDGDRLTLYTFEKQVLPWTDPYPFTIDAHELFMLFCWHVPNRIDDPAIECNALDPSRPRADDPAVLDNCNDGNGGSRTPGSRSAAGTSSDRQPGYRGLQSKIEAVYWLRPTRALRAMAGARVE